MPAVGLKRSQLKVSRLIYPFPDIFIQMMDIEWLYYFLKNFLGDKVHSVNLICKHNLFQHPDREHLEDRVEKNVELCKPQNHVKF